MESLLLPHASDCPLCGCAVEAKAADRELPEPALQKVLLGEFCSVRVLEPPLLTQQIPEGRGPDERSVLLRSS